MKHILFLGVLVLCLLLIAGAASARGGGGHGGGHGGGFHGGGHGGGGFHGGHWGGRTYAWGRPVYGGAYYAPYYPSYPYSSEWVPGYWAQECTTEYCEWVWVPGYRRW